MDPVGRRISFLAHTGDPAVGLGGDAAERIVAASDIVLVEIVDQARPVLAIAAARGRPIWTDLHDYDGSTAYHEEFLRAAEVVFLSDQALPDPRPFMAAQIQRGKRLVVCTRAEAGALALTADGRWIEVPAEAVPEIVDTNGAGDAFAAGVLFGELGGFPIERSLRFGARAAALSVGSSELASPALTAGVLLGLA